MKKNKSRSKKQSASKKLRKELESKLAIAFNEVVIQVGKAKKTDKVIEKFAKQLSKKVTLLQKDDSITPFIKEDDNLLVTAVDEAIEKKVSKKKDKTDANKTA
ncbi:hypothetical protein OQZ33_05250 [Pedobacter sp. MC2016-05]|uniref:hypothetical protein n=1 Tax=Pedobacter sp. MC2016-05 TaxID=2994474 RepID=UPI002246030F|nr:hypothetical protein [Pedobacter sp. MC2016-05]MCX2473729.1 hypothetical protein [Pedobacter sp. MC2016-05]